LFSAVVEVSALAFMGVGMPTSANLASGECDVAGSGVEEFSVALAPASDAVRPMAAIRVANVSANHDLVWWCAESREVDSVELCGCSWNI
jgi:hypothetical protein